MMMNGAIYLIQKKIALNSGSCNLFRLVNSSREIFRFSIQPMKILINSPPTGSKMIAEK